MSVNADSSTDQTFFKRIHGGGGVEDPYHDGVFPKSHVFDHGDVGNENAFHSCGDHVYPVNDDSPIQTMVSL